MPSLFRYSRRARNIANTLITSGWQWMGIMGSIGPDHPKAKLFGEFGEGSLLAFPPGSVYNEAWIKIGAGVTIAPWVTLCAGIAPGQQMPSYPAVSIGDRSLVGRGSHVIAHCSIEIGDDVQIGPYSYITDQNHGYSDPDTPIGDQWPINRPVKIGSGTWLGTGVVVLPGSTIGKNVVVGAGSVVTGSLPDRCVAIGSPARIVKRYDDTNGWVPVGDGIG